MNKKAMLIEVLGFLAAFLVVFISAVFIDGCNPPAKETTDATLPFGQRLMPDGTLRCGCCGMTNCHCCKMCNIAGGNGTSTPTPSPSPSSNGSNQQSPKETNLIHRGEVKGPQ